MLFSNKLASVDILSMFETLHLGIAVLSPEGVLLHCNSALARMLNTEQEAIQGRACRHVLRLRQCVAGCALGCGAFGVKDTGTNAENLALAGLAALTSLEGNGIETDLITAEHKKIPVRLTHIPVQDEAGKTVLFLDILEDISHVKKLELRLQQADKHKEIVGKSPAMAHILAILPSLAATDSPVLLTGETGTGKDLLAESMHAISGRNREPFVRVNISPMPEQNLLAELFGSNEQTLHGKFGLFQQAGTGTLYISELADIPLAVQTRLIKFVDEGVVSMEGQGLPIKVNARLVTATNKKPETLMEEGKLLPELYYRLNIGHIHLPALRERLEDIDFLLQYFLERFASRFKKDIQGFDPDVKKLLVSHNYPGNVRELHNIVEYAVMVCQQSLIGLESLPAYLMQEVALKAQVQKPVKRGKGGKKHEKA